jgi:hypothetical protein
MFCTVKLMGKHIGCKHEDYIMSYLVIPMCAGTVEAVGVSVVTVIYAGTRNAVWARPCLLYLSVETSVERQFLPPAMGMPLCVHVSLCVCVCVCVRTRVCVPVCMGMVDVSVRLHICTFAASSKQHGQRVISDVPAERTSSLIDISEPGPWDCHALHGHEHLCSG